MRKYALACAAAALLTAAAPRPASAWDIGFSFCISLGCGPRPCVDAYCGWPGYHFDPCFADGGSFDGAPFDGAPPAYDGASPYGYDASPYGYGAQPYGYGASPYGYGAPAAVPGTPSTAPAPSGQPAQPFPPAPKPADDKQASPRYLPNPYQPTGYNYGYPSSGAYAPAYGYGR
jgi:hypothetical protein